MKKKLLVFTFIVFFGVIAFVGYKSSIGLSIFHSIKKYHKLNNVEKKFFEAVYEHDLSRVQTYVGSGKIDVNVVNQNGSTAIQNIYSHMGITDINEKKKAAQVINYLIDHGYDIFYIEPNSSNYTMLHNAVMYDLYAVVEKLLDKGVETSSKNEYGNTALFSVESVEMLKLLLRRTSYKITDKDGHGNNLLFDCLGMKVYPELVAYLVDKVALEEKDKKGYTPLLRVVSDFYNMDKREEAIDILLEHGANVNAVNSQGASVLLEALRHGIPIQTIRKILEKGADVNQPNQFNVYPVIAAATYHEADVMELLYTKNADLNKVGGNDKLTALILASKEGNSKVVEYLIKHNAKLDVKDVEGKRALNYARELKFDDIIDMLEKAGAKVSSKEEREEAKKTIEALKKKESLKINNIKDAIRAKNSVEVAKFLESEEKENLKELAFYACQFSTLEILKLLEKKGLDLFVKNKNDETLLHMAVFYDNMEISDYLIKKGLDINAVSSRKRSVYILSSNASIKMYKSLIGKNIKINEKDKKEIIDNALYYNNIKLAEYLHEEGFIFDIDSYREEDAMALLVMSNKIETIKFIYEHGMDIEEKLKFAFTETTVLSFSASRANSELVQFFLKKGAKYNIATTNNGTGSAVDYIVQTGDIESLKLLMERGFDINKKEETMFWDYPLISALQNNQRDMILFLLDNNVTLVLDSGYSPLYLAARVGYLDVVKALIKRGSNPLRLEPNNAMAIDVARSGGYKLLVEYLESFEKVEREVKN